MMVLWTVMVGAVVFGLGAITGYWACDRRVSKIIISEMKRAEEEFNGTIDNLI